MARVVMGWIVMALEALGVAYAAAFMPALRWTEPPDDGALVASVSEPVGTWEARTANGRAICLGPPLTAANFTVAPVRPQRAPDDDGAAAGQPVRADVPPVPALDFAAPMRPYGLVADAELSAPVGEARRLDAALELARQGSGL